MKSWSDLLFYVVLALFTLPAFIVVFAATRALLHRFWPGQQHPKRIAGAVSVAATPFLCLAGGYLALTIYLYYPHREFQRDKWASDVNKRYEMVEDLQSTHQLTGLTKEQVANLLGTPDYQDAGLWVYHVGIKPSLFALDGDALSLEFVQGKVARYWVHQT
ncbi:hypothetical protein GCM10027346_23990 [Hymenobacter seoulensis]